MAENKFLDLIGLTLYDTLSKGEMDKKDAEMLKQAKAYSDSLSTNYDPAGTAQSKVDALANGAVKQNTQAIATLIIPYIKEAGNYVKMMISSQAVKMNDGKDLETTITELNNKLTDSGWVNCTMGNGIKAYNNDIINVPKVRKIGNVVYLKGVVENTTTWQVHETFLKIPEGYRPSYKCVFVMQGSGSCRYNITALSNGKIIADRYTNNTTMNQTVPTGSWLNMYCSWIIN